MARQVYAGLAAEYTCPELQQAGELKAICDISPEAMEYAVKACGDVEDIPEAMRQLRHT